MSVCWAHIVAATAQKSLGSLCVIRPFQTVQLTDLNNPTIGYGFYLSLSPLAKENESLNHFPLMVLKKVLFPIP